MSATGFHPDPSANAPWTRTIVLTAACAGSGGARAAPAIRAKVKRFMLQIADIMTSIQMTSQAGQFGSDQRTGPAHPRDEKLMISRVASRERTELCAPGLGMRYRGKPALRGQIIWSGGTNRTKPACRWGLRWAMQLVGQVKPKGSPKRVAIPGAV